MAKSFMIAITGGSGSGKTTLARVLHERFGEDRSVLVTEDNYYRPRAFYGEAAIAMEHSELERTFNFDDPAGKDMEQLRRDIEALKRGESIEQPVYDFPTHDRRHAAVNRIEARPVVIIEGIHVLSDLSFLPLFDLSVFVDAPADLRIIRRILRDGHERGRSAESVIQQYLAFVRDAYTRFIEPAKDACDVVVVCDAAAAQRDEAEIRASVAKLVEPVWTRLQQMGVAPRG